LFTRAINFRPIDNATLRVGQHQHANAFGHTGKGNADFLNVLETSGTRNENDISIPRAGRMAGAPLPEATGTAGGIDGPGAEQINLGFAVNDDNELTVGDAFD